MTPMPIVVTATPATWAAYRRGPSYRGVPATDIVAGARSLDAISGRAPAGVRTAVIDYDDSTTVEAAFKPDVTFVPISGNRPSRSCVSHPQASGLHAALDSALRRAAVPCEVLERYDTHRPA